MTCIFIKKYPITEFLQFIVRYKKMRTLKILSIYQQSSRLACKKREREKKGKNHELMKSLKCLIYHDLSINVKKSSAVLSFRAFSQSEITPFSNWWCPRYGQLIQLLSVKCIFYYVSRSLSSNETTLCHIPMATSRFCKSFIITVWVF